MVKIGALIGAFLATAGGIFLNLALVNVISGGFTWQNFRDSIAFSEGSPNPIGSIATVLFYLGIIVVLGSGFIKGKLLLKIGGGIMIIGIILVMAGWFTGAIFEPLYNIGGIIMFLGSIVYFIGCIHFRKHNVVTIITGFLLVISILFSQIISGTVMLVVTGGADMWRYTHLGSLIFQVTIFILHSWIFGFSKKSIQYSDKVEDTLSVEKGQAFASYVPTEMKKKKKSKKSSDDDDITFTF